MIVTIKQAKEPFLFKGVFTNSLYRLQLLNLVISLPAPPPPSLGAYCSPHPDLHVFSPSLPPSVIASCPPHTLPSNVILINGAILFSVFWARNLSYP